MSYYIYKIENQVNHKVYIGLTNNIVRRKSRHFGDLRHGRHDNHFLQKEFDIYGEDNFTFSVEFEGDVTAKKIGELEKEYIAKYDSYKNGYNQNEGGNFGPSNGGTRLTETDLFNILAVLEFDNKRPGEMLGKIFGVTRTTISRIKKGVNHVEAYEAYHKLSDEKRFELYQTFCDDVNFFEQKYANSKITTKRKLNEQQIHLILLNEEKGRPVQLANLQYNFGVTSNTIYTILQGQSYQDYALSYKKLTDEQKAQLATLLRNQ